MEPSETTVCANCREDIPSGNLVMHNIHCERNNTYCTECQEVVLKAEWADHVSQEHVQLPCPACARLFKKSKLQAHQQDDCSHRLQPCPWCELPVKICDKAEHEEYCGNRTELCFLCKRYIPLKAYDQHQNSGCQYPAHAAPAPDVTPTGSHEVTPRGSQGDRIGSTRPQLRKSVSKRTSMTPSVPRPRVSGAAVGVDAGSAAAAAADAAPGHPISGRRRPTEVPQKARASINEGQEGSSSSQASTGASSLPMGGLLNSASVACTAVMELRQFAEVPWLDYGDVPLNAPPVVAHLVLRCVAPAAACSVSVDRTPKKDFVCLTEAGDPVDVVHVMAGLDVILAVCWTPTAVGAVRESLYLKLDGRHRLKVSVVGVCVPARKVLTSSRRQSKGLATAPAGSTKTRGTTNSLTCFTKEKASLARAGLKPAPRKVEGQGIGGKGKERKVGYGSSKRAVECSSSSAKRAGSNVTGNRSPLLRPTVGGMTLWQEMQQDQERADLEIAEGFMKLDLKQHEVSDLTIANELQAQDQHQRRTAEAGDYELARLLHEEEMRSAQQQPTFGGKGSILSDAEFAQMLAREEETRLSSIDRALASQLQESGAEDSLDSFLQQHQ